MESDIRRELAGGYFRNAIILLVLEATVWSLLNTFVPGDWGWLQAIINIGFFLLAVLGCAVVKAELVHFVPNWLATMLSFVAFAVVLIVRSVELAILEGFF